MTFLQRLPGEVGQWADLNFGGPTRPSYPQLLGLTEEVGELCHAHLKGEQGIRHDKEEIRELKVDAVGDIMIFLANYCYCEDIDLDAAVRETWQKVLARDWVKHPEKGQADG